MDDFIHCIDQKGRWPNASADVASNEMDDFLAHAEVCPYHAEILNEEFEKELRSVFRLARGLDDEGRILRGDELQNAIAEHERRAREWEAVGSAESPFSLISLYNGGRLIAGSGKFHDYTYHQALHDLDPRAGLQIRARCGRDKDEEVLLGFYALEGGHHNDEELLLPLDNGYMVGVKVEQIENQSFQVHFRCVENRAIENAHPDALNQGRTTIPSRAYVLNDSLRDDPIDDKVKLLILEIRHLSKQQRYEEALGLARKATRIAPGYWRAQINLGSLLIMSGKVDNGEKIYQQVLKDFSENTKAVAAALHCCAAAKEIRCGLNPDADTLREVKRLYAEALELNGSLADTRACLLISLSSGETAKNKRLLEDSVLCEEFFDALQFEFTELETVHGAAKMQKFLHTLPIRFRNLLSPIGPNYAGGYSY